MQRPAHRVPYATFHDLYVRLFIVTLLYVELFAAALAKRTVTGLKPERGI